MRSALTKSVLIHFAIILLFLLVRLVMGNSFVVPRKIKVEIKEAPLVSEQKPATQPEIKMNEAPPKPAPVVAKKIFGLNKNTLQSDKPGAVEVKAGNTIAKEIDNEKINPEDADPLPIPTEEYLVQQMPRLKSEVRVPYPPQAKAKNIEGVVVMEVLIDDKGKVRQAKVLEGPGYGLNEAALEAIYKFEFSPAYMEKKPVAVRIRYAYRFVLN